MNIIQRAPLVAASLFLGGLTASSVWAELPEFEKISEGYEKIVVSDQQNKPGLFTMWKRDKDSQLLGELPRKYANKSYFIALTVSSGDRFAGLQAGDMVVKWRRYGDRLALIAPNLGVRATGDPESKASVKRLFTDQVLLDMPIAAMGPGGGPVVDFDALLVDNASRFFGPSIRITNKRISDLTSAKVFPENVEIAFEIVGNRGQLQTIHYSFSEVPASNNGFKPREADERVGYFTTAFSDLSKYDDEETRVRYINRWHLEKRDPKLKLSPPKQPIRFYVEHTAPVRYRRWIKQGVDYWNKAFEKVGLVDAIVIEYQDAQSGAHMEKDPEDVRYNFIRWLNNDLGTAIGPSRVHPETGEILDADIILTDGWIRHFNFNYEDLMPKLAMEGVSAETLAWLGKHPSWDPRVRMARPEEANAIRSELRRQAQQPMAGYEMAGADPSLLGDDEFDGLYGSISQKNGLCMAASGRSLDLALTRMNWALTLSDKGQEQDNNSDPVTGIWTIDLEAEQLPAEARTVTVDLNLADDGSVTGTADTPGGEVEITEGSFDADTGRLTLVVSAGQQGEAKLDATIEDGELTGTVELLGQQIPITGQRAQSDHDSPAGKNGDNGDEGDTEDDKDDQDEDEEEDEENETEEDDDNRDDEEKTSLLDGMPEWFVGPLLADLVAHEVGHTLGLRHNFKATSLHTLDEINSSEFKGTTTIASSVMDYTPINYRFESGETQGDYAMIDIGPYDYWAIEYGYTFEDKKLPEILKRCSEPELQYATDEDTSGPDPFARRYDFSKDPLDYAKEQTKLIRLYRDRILDEFVEDGDSWARARRGYELTLSLQTRAASMMANWIGSAFVNRDKKGDPGNRPPVEVVPAEEQREALKFVIDSTFRDEAYGLTPDLLERMSVDKWLDTRRFGSMSSEATWPIHDRILGVQAAALTWLMNPTTLRRVYDNELRLPPETDTLTLPELLSTINSAVWSELGQECPEGRSARMPMISSLRRNLQREHMQRLVDLILEEPDSTAAYKPISNLARMELRELSGTITESLKKCGDKMDAYSKAHLVETKERIDSALAAGYTYNGNQPKQPLMIMMVGQEGEEPR